MEEITVADLDFILESLQYTRLKFENYPIGENGYPSYEFKKERVDLVNSVALKIKKLKAKLDQ